MRVAAHVECLPLSDLRFLKKKKKTSGIQLEIRRRGKKMVLFACGTSENDDGKEKSTLHAVVGLIVSKINCTSWAILHVT